MEVILSRRRQPAPGAEVADFPLLNCSWIARQSAISNQQSAMVR
jgi:hypothetical protein